MKRAEKSLERIIEADVQRRMQKMLDATDWIDENQRRNVRFVIHPLRPRKEIALSGFLAFKQSRTQNIGGRTVKFTPAHSVLRLTFQPPASEQIFTGMKKYEFRLENGNTTLERAPNARGRGKPPTLEQLMERYPHLQRVFENAQKFVQLAENQPRMERPDDLNRGRWVAHFVTYRDKPAEMEFYDLR